MRTVAVTGGLGNHYSLNAKRFTDRFNHLSQYVPDGFECINVNNLLHTWRVVPLDQWFLKAYLWDVLPDDIERLVWFDCDIVQMRPIGLSDLPDVPFAAAPDSRWTDVNTFDLWPPSEDVERFFNSGVMICKRETRDVFDQVKEIAEKINCGEIKKQAVGDQRWFNLFVARKYKDYKTNPTGWHILGNEWNFMKDRDKPLRPIFIHFAGVNNRWTLMDFFYYGMAENERFVLGLKE